MSGYGYGDSAKRRRDRGDRGGSARDGGVERVASSRSADRNAEKRAKGKKDKKDKKQQREPEKQPQPDKHREPDKHRDPVKHRELDKHHGSDKRREPEDQRARKMAKRSRSRDRAAQAPAARAPAPEEAALGRSRMESFGEAHQKKSAWREEIEKRRKDDDDEAPPDGIVAMEDDESVEQTLAASRARREQLIAKWVNRGENGMPGSLETVDTPLEDDDDDDEEADEHREADAATAATDAPVDEATLKDRQAIMRFIVNSKAEHDGDDMFGEKADEEALNRVVNKSAAISQTGASADDWDDAEGYYKAKIGEVMAGRYLVTEDFCGKGVFSNVVKCKDQQDGSAVAIKVMRCNDMMKKAAEKEMEVLYRLNRLDRANKKHVIRLIRHFSYRGHLCLVFECMWDNLRVALKKYTKDKGMSLQAVRAYTKQLLIALRHIHRCSIIHADIKPDNILISAGHNIVKICDLGSATELTEVEITPYLVSRFYRAPEIVLGIKYGTACDVFAMGCSLYELFTGKILFAGRSNNDMMRLFMEVKGKMPHKMIKSGQLWKNHFDENLDFKYEDVDKVTRKKKERIITDLSAKRSILDAVMGRVGKEKQQSTNSEDQLYCKKAKQFADLVGQMTTLDPEKRISAHDALQHPFLVEAGLGSKPPETNKKGPPRK